MLGVQELSSLYSSLNSTADSTLLSLQSIASSLQENDTLRLEVINGSSYPFESLYVRDSVWSQVQSPDQTICSDTWYIPEGYYAEVSVSPSTSNVHYGWRMNGSGNVVNTDKELWMTGGESMRFCVKKTNCCAITVQFHARMVAKLYPIAD